MIDLPYSLVIEATNEPDYFGFYSSELKGFSGIGGSVEDCLYKAKWGMKEHIAILAERSMPIPPVNRKPVVTNQNEEGVGVGNQEDVDCGWNQPATRQRP